MQLWSDEIETESANPGENVRVKLKNIEEEVGFLYITLSNNFTATVVTVLRCVSDV